MDELGSLYELNHALSELTSGLTSDPDLPGFCAPMLRLKVQPPKSKLCHEEVPRVASRVDGSLLFQRRAHRTSTKRTWFLRSAVRGDTISISVPAARWHSRTFGCRGHSHFDP